MAKKAQWFTPLNQLKSKEEAWQRIENSGWKPPKIDMETPMTYFNNPLKYQWSAYYDHFFAYTKVFPLWDRRKAKDNSQYPPDIRDNIYMQEKDKTVPVLTSFNYGLACRKPLDTPDTEYRRINAIADFRRRRGVEMVKEKKLQ